MWIVQVTKNKFGHKLNLKKYQFKTRDEAEHFARNQGNYAEVYQLEHREVKNEKTNHY